MRYFLLLCLIGLIACEQDKSKKVYEVPAELESHVKTFVQEAFKRGKRLEVDDLIIDYRNNIFIEQKRAAGICTRRFGHTPIIHIDTTTSTWKYPAGREQVIFHELCHCLLDRNHEDALLLNGNFKSMMRPRGESLYASFLTAYKRDYYMDEMFDPNTASPAWVQNIESSQDTLFTDTIFFENFTFLSSDSISVDSIKLKTWRSGSNSKTETGIVNNQFKIKTLEKAAFYTPFNFKLDSLGDFQVQLTFIWPEKPIANAAFYWGGTYSGDMYNILISPEGFITIGQNSLGPAYAGRHFNVIPDALNYLIIRKEGDFYYYFINGEYIDKHTFEPLNGSLCGLGISGEASAICWDEILILKSRASNQADK